jgi:hypothetical protein
METYNEYLNFIESKIGKENKNTIDKWRNLTPSDSIIEDITNFIRPFNNNDRTIIYPLSFERKFKLNDYQKLNSDFHINENVNFNDVNLFLYVNKNDNNIYKVQKNEKICTIIIDKKINFIGNTNLTDQEIKYLEDKLNKKRHSL